MSEGFHNLAGVSFRSKPACENEKQAKERGRHKYLPGTAGRCSMRVIVSCSKGKRTDWCKTYTCFAHCHIRLLPLELCPTCCSCLDYLPTVTSVLRWKHRQNLNVNILAVDRQNEQTEECLSLCGNHPSNERLPHHIVCWRNDHF